MASSAQPGIRGRRRALRAGRALLRLEAGGQAVWEPVAHVSGRRGEAAWDGEGVAVDTGQAVLHELDEHAG